MRILILSDLHLDKPRGGLKRFDIEDAVAAIESLQQYTAGIDAVVIAGDIFNAVKIDSVPVHLLSKLNKVLEIIPKKYTIRGNHDRGRFSILEDVCGYTALSQKAETIGCGISISGCDFTDIDTHRNYLQEATSDILVCHFPMSPFSTFGESNISVTECPQKRVVIVGDTHKPAVYAQDDRCVISPGCLFPADRTELLSGYAGSGFILNIEKQDGELSIGLSQIWLNSRFGADLSSIKTRDELVLGLQSIDARGPFPANLKPVAYVDPSVIDTVYPSVELIAAPKAVSESAAISADFSGLEGEDVDSRIRRILSKLYEHEDNHEYLLELTMELISTDDPSAVLSQFLTKN